MNIFVLDEDIETCARYHCDKHVVKMILESAQMLCTVNSKLGLNTPYKPVHPKHPCTLWAGTSLSNWKWLKELSYHLNNEYVRRYNKPYHKSWKVIESLEIPNIEDIGLTRFAQAMPPMYKQEDSVNAYREYYRGEKREFATWKNTEIPSWWIS